MMPARFDDALRRWAGRPARLNAREASRLLKARLAAGRLPATPRLFRARWAWPLAAAGAVTVLVAGGILVRRGLRFADDREATRRQAGELRPVRDVVPQPPPLDDNVVLQWIDAETPVYFVIPSRRGS